MATEDRPRPDRLGLIAGYGTFPLELASTLSSRGIEVHAVAMREETSSEIEQCAASVHWLHIGQVGGMLKAFKAAGITRVIMAGKVRKIHLFRNFRPDLTALKELVALPDRRDDSIMNAVAGLLEKEGIQLLSQLAYAGDMLAGSGHLFGPKPGKAASRDMEFGLQQAYGLAALDIGQTVVVQDCAVLAVEAIEGTDEAIRRGGKLGSGKASVIKVAKPAQDARFDVPAVGPDTLDTMHVSGCRTLAVQAGLTLLLERDRFARLASRLRISVCGLEAT